VTQTRSAAPTTEGSLTVKSESPSGNANDAAIQ